MTFEEFDKLRVESPTITLSQVFRICNKYTEMRDVEIDEFSSYVPGDFETAGFRDIDVTFWPSYGSVHVEIREKSPYSTWYSEPLASYSFEYKSEDDIEGFGTWEDLSIDDDNFLRDLEEEINRELEEFQEDFKECQKDSIFVLARLLIWRQSEKEKLLNVPMLRDQMEAALFL